MKLPLIIPAHFKAADHLEALAQDIKNVKLIHDFAAKRLEAEKLSKKIAFMLTQTCFAPFKDALTNAQGLMDKVKELGKISPPGSNDGKGAPTKTEAVVKSIANATQKGNA